MQLNITTDYAIRIVVYLATVGESTSGAEISRVMAIPPKYLREIAKKLLAAEIICSTQGAKGGYELARSPRDITLADIIGTMEGTTRINRCLEADHYCSRKATGDCPVRKFYQLIQSCVDSSFADMTVERLLRGDIALPEGVMQKPRPGGERSGLGK